MPEQIPPKDDEDLEHLILSRSARFQALLDKSRQSVRAGKGIPHEEFWKTVAERQKAKDDVAG